MDSEESEIIREDGLVFYADVIDISLDNLEKVLNRLNEDGNFLYKINTFLFLTTDKTDIKFLTAKNISDIFITNKNCPKSFKQEYCANLESLIRFMNKHQAIPIFLVSYHVSHDSLYICSPKNILTLER